MDIKCYACERPAVRQCPVCRVVFCEEHGGERCLQCGGSGTGPTASPSPLASPWLFRGMLAILLVGLSLGLSLDLPGWLRATLGTPPESGEASLPLATDTPTAAATAWSSPTAAASATPLPTATVAPTRTPTTAPSPTPTATPMPTSTATPTPLPVATDTPEPKYTIHKVQPGESLKSIAEQYGTTPEILIVYNGLRNPDLLQEGQEIAIPQ